MVSISHRIAARIRSGLTRFTDERIDLGYEYVEEAYPLIERVRPFTMVPYQNLALLYEQVRHVEEIGLPGAFVECGVWKGGSVGLMALANLSLSEARRDIHLFDAFDDICEPDPEMDGEQAVEDVYRLLGRRDVVLTGERRPVVGVYDAKGGFGDLAAVRELINGRLGYPTDFTRYHKGYFEETVPVVAPKIDQIALLRLDGDWYSSTKVCLDHLFDRVVTGGFVIIDDYGAYEGCRRAVNEFLAGRGLTPLLAYSNKICRYWEKAG